MRGLYKLTSVKHSTPLMAKALPGMPMSSGVMVRLVRILASTMTDYFEPVFRKLGLTENIFHVLCLLVASDKGQASPGELTEMVGTSKANMTRIIDQLLKGGLVTRSTNAMDARRYSVQITEKGRELANESVPKIKEPLMSAFSGLTPEEIETLKKLVKKAVISLDTKGEMLSISEDI